MAGGMSAKLREPLLQPVATRPRNLPPEHNAPVTADLYLLVIAHPDDESMFFSPTIRSILEALRSGAGRGKGKSPKVSVLSLSNGGYDGLGRIRAVELWRAASALGLLWWDLHGDDNRLVNDDDDDDGEGAVAVLDDERMKDGPDEAWDEDVVADAVLTRIRKILGVDVAAPRPGDGSPRDELTEADELLVEEDTIKSVVESSTPAKERGVASDDETATMASDPDDGQRGTEPSHPPRVVVLTFDSGGVSDHPNHVSTHRGVKRLLLRTQTERRRRCSEAPGSSEEPTGEADPATGSGEDRSERPIDIDVCGYELVTVRNPVAKYTPFLDLLRMLLAFLFRVVLYLLGLTTTLSAAAPPLPAVPAAFEEVDPAAKVKAQKGMTATVPESILTYRTFEPHVVWSAMAAHATQFVWYRRLSVLFSRYTYWNELRPIIAGNDRESHAPADRTEGESSIEWSSSSVGDAAAEVVPLPDVRLAEEPAAAPPPILTRTQMRRVAGSVLPPATRLKRWTRLYGLARDGDSFVAFLDKVRGAEPSLLVVKTTRGDVFGAYADSSWEPHGGGFYGGGMACLWRIKKEGPERGDDDEAVHVFRWSGLNRCVQLCDPLKKTIALGGGGIGGDFGLCLSGDFLRGTTGPCETFQNEPLCEAEEGTFEVLNVECWGFTMDLT